MSTRHRASPERSAEAKQSPVTEPADDNSDSAFGSVHKTVALNDRDVRAAAKLLNLLIGEEVDRGRELTRIVDKGRGMGGHHDRRLLVEHARHTFASRAQRARFFNRVMFGEAAWDMLLALYVTDQSGSRHTVSNLANLSGAPPTTALRWIEYLEQEQLVARRSNPLDGRVYFVQLTDKAREALDAYFSETAAT